ncbi:MAG: hypothetical protein AMXMBFR64_33460 [Myxococcales bacterium]
MGDWLGSLVRLANDLAARLMTVLAQVSAGIETAWRELSRAARDAGFKAMLLGYLLGRILVGLSPGVVLVSVGLIGEWPWVWLAGVTLCAGLITWAALTTRTSPRDSEEDRAVAWVIFFPPWWRDQQGLRTELGALVRTWLRVDDALLAARASLSLQHPVRTHLMGIRDLCHRRMHRLRGDVTAALRRRRGVPGSVDMTRAELLRIGEVVEDLVPRLLPAEGGDEAVIDDGLSRAIDLLEEIKRSLRSLDRR